MADICIFSCNQLVWYDGGVCGDGGVARDLRDVSRDAMLWGCAVFGVYHVAGFAKEVDVEFVVDYSIELTAECGTK